MRPLISTGDPKKSVDISRKAELYETSSGMLTITGGKLTTWRRMAKQTVDRLVEREGREAPCRTDEIPLGMAAGEEDLDLPDGLSEATAGGRSRAARLPLRPRGAQRARGRRRAPRAGGADRRRAAPTCSPRRWSRRASSRRARVADVLLRRTRLGILAAPQLRDAESVTPVAEAMGGGAGLGRGRVEAEAEAWVERPRAEGVDPAG